MMLPVSHESFISNSGTSVSHREKYANSLFIEDEDPAPTMSEFSFSSGASLLDCFDPSPELLFLLDPPPEILFF
ncbi:hypothetical protein YC2023_049180 [Brassica napus]|uniref:Uncharacterized protein n=1 Tax=Brassica oleracea TaxID=3712 RepID=A0A3P6BSN6_BRAOL|nr:unnamed protein product [Brassica oleracea]